MAISKTMFVERNINVYFTCSFSVWVETFQYIREKAWYAQWSYFLSTMVAYTILRLFLQNYLKVVFRNSIKKCYSKLSLKILNTYYLFEIRSLFTNHNWKKIEAGTIITLCKHLTSLSLFKMRCVAFLLHAHLHKLNTV